MSRSALNLFQLCCSALLCAFAIGSAAAEEPSVLSGIFPTSWEYDGAQSPSLESVVDDLSERVEAVEEENRWLRSAVHDGWQDRVSEIWQNGENAMEFQGRIHADVWSYPHSTPGVNAFETGDSTLSPQDRLDLRRARFALEGELPYETLYKLDFEFSEASLPQFRDLYIGWGDVPIVGKLLFGNQKRPYGLDHLNSSNFNVFMERPFIVQAFNRNNRRYGLMAYGVSADESWNWRYGVVNLREIQSDGVYISDHWQLEAVGRLARTLVDSDDNSRYVHLAIAPSYAQPDGDPGPGQAKNEAQFQTEPEARTDRVPPCSIPTTVM
jgi:phosphate-selective porin OprO/OprP